MLWQMNKVVVYAQDLSQFGLRQIRGRYIKRTDKGLPDIVAYVKKGSLCAIIFFELKINTKQSEHQLAWMLKFKDISNVWYFIINSADEIDTHIENITGHYSNTLKEMTI